MASESIPGPAKRRATAARTMPCTHAASTVPALAGASTRTAMGESASYSPMATGLPSRSRTFTRRPARHARVALDGLAVDPRVSTADVASHVAPEPHAVHAGIIACRAIASAGSVAYDRGLMARKRLGEILMDAGHLTEEHLSMALAEQKRWGRSAGTDSPGHGGSARTGPGARAGPSEQLPHRQHQGAAGSPRASLTASTATWPSNTVCCRFAARVPTWTWPWPTPATRASSRSFASAPDCACVRTSPVRGELEMAIGRYYKKSADSPERMRAPSHLGDPHRFRCRGAAGPRPAGHRLAVPRPEARGTPGARRERPSQASWRCSSRSAWPPAKRSPSACSDSRPSQ